MISDGSPRVTNATAVSFPRFLRLSLHDVISGQRFRRLGWEHAHSLVEVNLGRDFHDEPWLASRCPPKSTNGLTPDQLWQASRVPIS